MSQGNPEEQWPAIKKEERTLHEILFYSQGPVDGCILGEGIRDLLLKSGLSLTVLSQIWNLADVSNDNVLNVHEFVLIMHLIRGVMSGRAIPKTLPRTLIPPKTAPQTPPPMTQQEKDAYLRVFQTVDYSRAGFIDGVIAAEMFLATKLPVEVLAQIWDLSEFGRDGKLNPEKFAIACHLLRYAKKGGSLDGPVDIFHYSPQHVSPLSLLARKRRVSEYEEHKQRLMSLKERRKIQAVREARRLDLVKVKVECLQELYELLTKLDKETEAVKYISKTLLKDKTDIEKQEEISLRLKKEHEKVRQETVKIILGEQKFYSDISIIKKDTEELNKRLMLSYTHATKDPDPFHQLYEQRKEKRQGSTIKDLDKIDIYIPFEFSPFDLEITPDTLPSGMEIIKRGNNHEQSVAEIKSVIADLKEFGEQFMDLWGESVSIEKTKEFEDDEIFREVHDWSEDNWPNWDWSEDGLLGLTDPQAVTMKRKLSDLREELKKLNNEGGRLVFRNSEDYYARRKALEEEEKVEKGRVKRRSVTERLRSGSEVIRRTRDSAKRYSYTSERTISTDSGQAAQAAREYRLKRRSANFDSSPEILRHLDRERQLYRTSTDPASVSDEGSLSRESSQSSFDQPVSPRGSSRRLEEESSTIRTQCSSRTDDSGILTFRSSEDKGDFSLVFPAVSQLSLNSVSAQTEETPMFSQRSRELPVDIDVSQQNQRDLTVSAFTSTEPQEEVRKKDELITLRNAETDTSTTSPTVSRTSSKRNRAPAPPATVSPTIPLSDNSEESETYISSQCKLSDISVKFESRLVETPPVKAVQSGYIIHEDISLTAAGQHTDKSSITGTTSDVAERNNLTSTEITPQRPPRLKKRSDTSESPQGPSTPTILSPASHTSSSVTESHSKHNHGNSSFSELASDEVKEKEVINFELLSNIRSDTDLQKHTQNSQTSPDLTKDIYLPLTPQTFSFDHNSTERIRKESDFDYEKSKNEEAEPKMLTAVTDRSSKKNTDVIKAEDALIERDNCIIQSETILRVPHTPSISTAPDNTQTSKAQIHLDVDKGRTMSGNEHIPNDSDIDGAPPPLPSSAPPPLPASIPPSPASISTETEEKVISLEYTVPITSSSKAYDNSPFSEHHESQSSSIYFNGLADVPSSKTVTASIVTPTDTSPETREKGNEICKESAPKSKTISDLRSDFFGLKCRRPNKKLVESDLIETPTTASRYFLTKDFQIEDKMDKRLVYGNSLDSSISDSDSGVPMSVIDDTFSPGDSGHLSLNMSATPEDMSSFISSERCYTLSNDSTESTFDDSFLILSTPSGKLSQQSATVVDVIHTRSSVPALATKQSSASVSKSAGDTSAISHKKENHMSPSFRETDGQIKHVTETEQSKHTRVLKADISDLIPEGTSKQNMLDLGMHHSTVNSFQKVNNQFQHSVETEILEESLQGGKSPKSSNPSEYGFVYSAERPTPPPEAGWSEKQAGDHKVNLYSENVVQEKETTESVDRESIANLCTTKKQWENIFSSHSTSQGETSVKQKATPKWEVRLPYKEKHASPVTNKVYSSSEEANIHSEEDPTMFRKPEVSESAIEREIRLAHEREEMLRKEKEERQRLIEKQKSQGQPFMASYTTSSAESESNQPAYNELAEADRNPDVWAVKHEENNSDGDEENNESDDVNPNESIIEREIRLQREREAEVARMRKLAQQQLQPQQQHLQQQEQHYIQQSEHHNAQKEDKEDINHNQTNALPHEDSVTSSSNAIENKIVMELRELKEREEEIKRLHSSIHRIHVTDETDGPRETSPTVQKAHVTSTNSERFSQAESPSSQVSWQRDVSSFLSPQRRESVDSTSSHSTARSYSDSIPSRRDVKVRPIADSNDADEEDQKTDYFQKQETPIEREIRLARERENELRKQKGLPEIDQKEDDNPYSSYAADQETTSISSVSRPRSLAQPGNSMKKFATNRLQHELQEQKERELMLLSEGKIITTSEQHIQPLKFVEVSGVDYTDGAVKRNFVTRKTGASYNDSDTQGEHHETASPSGPAVRKTLSVGPGGQLFSYREFKQTAESKIERELREMKEREEELRKQRTGASVESPQK